MPNRCPPESRYSNAAFATRHDVWRRVTCNWIAGKVVRGLIDEADAPRIAGELAYGCGKRTYRLA